MTEHRTLRAANAARQAEWDKDAQITLSYRGNELAGETGEACNVIKKLERERLGIAGSRATVEQLAAELADVVICADLVALAEGIDLEAAVATKFNATSIQVGLKTRLDFSGPQLPKGRFLLAMADRFMARSDMEIDDAVSYATQVFDAFAGEENIEFGDPAYDWSASGADEIADNDMQYWEA